METAVKSRVQSPAFYEEAEDMQKGWGNTLRHIDELKDKVEALEDITLSDARFVLYGECHTSYVSQQFQTFCEEHGWSKLKMPWPCWKGLFDKMPNKNI